MNDEMKSAAGLASLAADLHVAAPNPEDEPSLGKLLLRELAIFRHEQEAALGFTGFAECPEPPE